LSPQTLGDPQTLGEILYLKFFAYNIAGVSGGGGAGFPMGKVWGEGKV
jgi:hypothetical protein